MSRPADPSAPSFLTTLPPEARNAVYEALFKRDDPVLLHNADAYYPEHPMRSDHACEEDPENSYIIALEDYNQVFHESTQQAEEFRHNFGCGLSMLLSCRQVYHECAGVLYGSNTFVISRSLHRHDIDARFQSVRHNPSYDQFAYAPAWLSGIGSQVDLIRQVSIDISATCPSDCWKSKELFDIRPYLLLCWAHPELERKLQFSQMDRRVIYHCSDTHVSGTVSTPVWTAELLNNILNKCVSEDILGIKKYGKFSRLLHEVQVSSLKGRVQVRVEFNNTDRKFEYEISKDGSDAIPIAHEPPDNFLLRIPQHVLHRVCQLTAGSFEGIIFDLDTRTIRGLSLSLLQVDAISRRYRDLWTTVAKTNSITLRASTSNIVTSFDDFSALSSIFHMSVGDFHCPSAPAMILYSSGEQPIPLKIELHFNISTAASPMDLDINILGLSRIIQQHDNLVVQVLLTCLCDERTYNEVLDLDTTKLRMDIFIVLAELLDYWLITVGFHEDFQLESIRIDGRGTLRSITLSNASKTKTHTFNNKYSQHTKEQVQHLGYHRTAICEEMEVEFRWKTAHSTGWFLIENLLSALRCMYWSDFKKRGVPLRHRRFLELGG